ncbi:MAG: EMC3/TMCO1 family protein [archaeon]
MGLFNIIDPVLDAVLLPLTKIGIAWGLIIITFVISLSIVFIYRMVTDQDRMRHLREEMKKFQDRMKTLKDEPQKMMKEQQKMMATNMELMKHSMKPTLYTFIPIIIIFGWLASHFAFIPIVPGEAFNISIQFHKGAAGDVGILVPDGMTLLTAPNALITDNRATWTLSGPEGEYTVYFDYNNEKLQKRVLISEELGSYARADKNTRTFFDFIYSSREDSLSKESSAQRIHVDYKPVKPLPFSLFGWRPGWLGTYILFSLLFSIGIRKLLKVY